MKQNKVLKETNIAEKQIECYFCGSDRIRATVDFSIEKPPRPKINISCADCKEGGIGLLGVEITLKALRFIFFAEDQA